MPQRFHAGDVPRIGGISILAGLLVGWSASLLAGYAGDVFNVRVDWHFAWPWYLTVLPAVAAGLYEDMTQRLSVTYRMLLTAVSAAIACAFLDLSIGRVDVFGIDNFLAMAPWAGVLFAFLAICGLPHAFNIIDGYNGLAGTVAILVCVALVHVALQLGDRQLASMLICLLGATAGFLFWNYPRGLIFAGDGGAYLWGVVVAIGSILLVQRHEQVSAWFPMLLLIYPVWETIFSIYRKIARGVSPSVADALHFHQLVYRRIVRGVFHDDASRRMLMRNNRTSPYLWSFTLLTIVPAVMFWNNTAVLAGFCGLFVVSYVTAYVAIIRFKVPDWLRR
ncbi:MAG: glycosyl transferase, family 4 [Polaromonas sp.]|nr:glycosyl transferase, family 4 [Polaromonas sp.]